MALGQIAEQFYPALLNYGLKINHDREQLRDILQELFLDLWAHRETLSMPANIKAYLFGAYRNKIYKARQRFDRSVECEELAFDSDAVDAEVPMDSFLIREETQTRYRLQVSRLIAKLSRRQQEVIFLHYYEEMDSDQIAEVMNISRQGVYNLLSRTLKELRKAWLPGHVFSFVDEFRPSFAT